MITEPKVVTKEPQPFAAMVLTLQQPEIARMAPPLIQDVIDWLKAKGETFTGPPFFNYVAFLPDGRMEMHVGMPTARLLEGDGRIATGTIPGGRYASTVHTGPYHELYEANMALDDWARAEGYGFAGTDEGDRFTGATRLEIYRKDPGEDPSGHPVAEVAFRLAD